MKTEFCQIPTFATQPKKDFFKGGRYVNWVLFNQKQELYLSHATLFLFRSYWLSLSTPSKQGSQIKEETTAASATTPTTTIATEYRGLLFSIYDLWNEALGMSARGCHNMCQNSKTEILSHCFPKCIAASSKFFLTKIVGSHFLRSLYSFFLQPREKNINLTSSTDINLGYVLLFSAYKFGWFQCTRQWLC